MDIMNIKILLNNIIGDGLDLFLFDVTLDVKFYDHKIYK